MPTVTSVGRRRTSQRRRGIGSVRPSPLDDGAVVSRGAIQIQHVVFTKEPGGSIVTAIYIYTV